MYYIGCFVLHFMLRDVIDYRMKSDSILFMAFSDTLNTGGFLFETAMPLFQAQDINRRNYFVNFDEIFCK